MALTWDTGKIKNRREVCSIPNPEHPDDPSERLLNPVTHALIFTTMSVDIGEITEANAADFYARTAIIERLDGAMLSETDDETGERKDRPLTPQDVIDHIGLRCNVGTKSFSQWRTRTINRERDRHLREFNQAIRNAKETTPA